MANLEIPFPSRREIREHDLHREDFIDWVHVDTKRKFITMPDPADDKVPLYAHHYCIGAPVVRYELKARMIMHPVCTKPAVVPVSNIHNDMVCIRERIEKVRNTKRLSGCARRKASEFVDYVVKRIIAANHGELLRPETEHDTLLLMPRQDRARVIEQGILSPGDEFGRMVTFQKLESYADPKAPRNISPVPEQHLLHTCQYTYPFDRALKNACFDWYMPGRNPREVGEQVAKITINKSYFGADYSKFDGHQNSELRWIAGRIVRDCFQPEFRARWTELMHREVNAVATTSNGLKYEAKGTMLSGCSLTTIGNTLVNAYLYYSAFKTITPDPDYIFKMMDLTCALYGDDSAGPKVIEKAFFEVCEAHGIKAKAEDCSYGLSFLGRIYFRDGEEVSIFDPRRIYPKLHITTSPGPLAQAACNRAHGLIAMCPGETWITDICDAILDHYGNLAEDKSLWNSEDYFKEHLRGRDALPGEHYVEAVDLVECMLGLPEDTLESYVAEYSRGLFQPRFWLDNGDLVAEFPETYIWDSYNYEYEQFYINPPK